MNWMDDPDIRDGAAREEFQRDHGVRLPPLWARQLLDETSDTKALLVKFVLEENGPEAEAMLFRAHVISRYAELITADLNDIRDPLFRVMVRLSYTAHDPRYGARTPDDAWEALWSVLRETPEGIEHGADYFCAWFFQRQEEFFYPEPPFERFAPWAYMDGDSVVDRFPGLTEAMANAAEAAKEIAGKQKASRRKWGRR